MKEKQPLKEAASGVGYSDSTHAPKGITTTDHGTSNGRFSMLHYHLSIKISEVTTKSRFLRLLSLIRLEGITQALEAGLFVPQIMVLLLLSSACLKYDNNFRFIVRPYRDGGSRSDRMSLFFADISKNSDIGARQRHFLFPKQTSCCLFFAVLQKTVTRMSLLF